MRKIILLLLCLCWLSPAYSYVDVMEFPSGTPTEVATRTEIEGLAGGHDAATVTDTTTIDLTLTGQDIKADAKTGAVANGAATLTTGDQVYDYVAGIGTTPVTLDANADVFLKITGQELGLDTQVANRFFAGPATGADTVPTFRALAVGDVPTLNQNTTGSAAKLSISGKTGLLSFTGLDTTDRAKTVRDAADTLLELGGSYTPTGTWNWATATVTWPTFNQNTSGTAANLSGTPALPNGTTATTQAASDNSTKLATTAYVDTGLGGKQAADADLTTYAGITPTANAQTLLGETFAQMQASLSIDDLITLSGMAEGSVNLSTFTGTTINDNVTVKAALQALETAVETKSPVNNAVHTGTFGIANDINASGLRHCWRISIVNPNAVVTASTIIPIGESDANLTITKIVVTTSSASYEVAGDLKYADARIGLANPVVINDFDTSSGVRTDTTITSAAVASGKFIYLSFDSAPNASMTDCEISIYFDYD